MKLSDLLKNISYTIENENLNIDILDIENNSSKIVNGSLFLAIKGTKTNGADFIDQAIKKGAVAVLSDVENKSVIDTKKYPNVPFIFVENIRLVESIIANNFLSKAWLAVFNS